VAAAQETGASDGRPAMGAKAILVSAAILCSRILGLGRELIFAALFGATPLADAFNVAFRVPNMLRDLFAEGVLSSAFIPTFADYLRNRGMADAIRLANVVIGALLVVVGGITLLGILAAPQVVALIAPGFDAYKLDLAIPGTRLLFPFLPVISLAAVAMGQLNAQERYGAPAYAPATFNVVVIVAGCSLLLFGAEERVAYFGWAVANLVAGAAQLLIQVPSLRKTGFRFRPRLDWSHPGLRRIVRLMAPATAGLAAVHVNIFVTTIFASRQPGAISWLNYGFRMIYLPIGLFGVAVATIATTQLAQRAADHDVEGLKTTLERGLRLVAFLPIPSTAGLIALREPIIRLLFERAAFTAEDTVHAAAAMLLYSLGLFAYSAVKVVAPAFYALDQPRGPFLASLSAVLVNLAISWALFDRFGYGALAFGVAMGSTVNFLVLMTLLGRIVGEFDTGTLVRYVAVVAFASLFCGAGAYLVAEWIMGLLGTDGALARLLAVGPGILVGAALYAAACRALDVPELASVEAYARQRLGRRS
jgi:putative peptidoglycan lipid II flippase